MPVRQRLRQVDIKFQATLLREFDKTSLEVEYLPGTDKALASVLGTPPLLNKDKTNKQPSTQEHMVTCLMPSMYVILSL